MGLTQGSADPGGSNRRSEQTRRFRSDWVVSVARKILSIHVLSVIPLPRQDSVRDIGSADDETEDLQDFLSGELLQTERLYGWVGFLET